MRTRAAHGRVEDFEGVDVRQLSRSGALEPGTSTYVESIDAEVEAQADWLLFRFADSDVEVDLERALTSFGSTRPWFRCPRCDARRLILYLPRLLCRVCLDLRYTSQSMDWIDRKNAKTERMRRKLGAPLIRGAPLEKPVRMSWKVFQRRAEEIAELEGIVPQLLHKGEPVLLVGTRRNEFVQDFADFV